MGVCFHSADRPDLMALLVNKGKGFLASTLQHDSLSKLDVTTCD